jgi:hypothetical protein
MTPATFNWLDEYGPHWEPGSTAFWLEPRKASDLEAWLAKYRPDFWGEMIVGDVTVNIPRKRDYIGTAKPKPALPPQMPAWDTQQGLLSNAALQQAAMMQNAIGLGGLNHHMARQQAVLLGGLFGV